MTTAVHRRLVLLLVALAGCAHRAPSPALPAIQWPAAPAAPRAELAAVLPDADRPATASRWRALLDAISGFDRREHAALALVRPFGLTVSGGALVVADPDAGTVVRFDDRGRPTALACKGRAWGSPMAVADGGGGVLYVADAGTAEVIRLAPGGACTALGAGVLERPTGVAVAGDRLLVADPPRHVVVVLSLDGVVLARWGGEGSGDGQLRFPSGLAVTEDGTTLVVDALNFRVARFAADGGWGGAFGERGDAGGALARPKAVAVDTRGRIYVSDAQRDLVLVYAPDGAFEYAIGESGSAPGQLALPAGIAVGGGRLHVADSHNRRVQVFKLLGGSQ